MDTSVEIEYELVFRLSALYGAQIIQYEDDLNGGCQEGIFIPFKENNIRLSKRKEVYVPILLMKNKQLNAKYAKNTHVGMQKLTFTQRQYLRELGYKNYKSIGFMKRYKKTF